MAWFFVGVAVASCVISGGWLANIRPGWPRWYRGRRRGPSATHPATKAFDTQPSTAPLTEYERWLEGRFNDAKGNR